MEPLLALDIQLPAAGSRALLRALHRQLRAAILDGRLRPGLRLPATRALAQALGVSRNTALAAYDLLLSEGYLVARPGAGTFVAETLPRPAPTRRAAGPDPRLAPPWRAQPGTGPASEPGLPDDFRVGLPDAADFPFDIWRRLADRALRAAARTPSAVADYADPQGQPALREAIAAHVAFTRAVACRPEDVVVTAGAQQAFRLLAQVLVVPGRTVAAVEDPGYLPLRAALQAAGAQLVPVPVDNEGLRVDRLPPEARLVCTTPSHQFPLGMAMSPRRRAELLAFARAQRAVVLEDDYDSEFRFAGRPLDALQTLDREGSVCYVGTFSKSLFPTLRLGFVVAPPWTRAALVAARRLEDWHSPSLPQETLAAFIAEGHLARHLRRMRRVYGERRAALLDALARHGAGRIAPIPSEAGLHLSAWLRDGTDAEALAARAAGAGIALSALGRYAAAALPAHGLAFGYGLIAAPRIDAAVRRLAALLD